MIYRLILLAASVGITVAYVLAPGGKFTDRPESLRMMFFHVPPAMLCSLFFLWGAVMGGIYLAKRRPVFDDRSLAAIELGTMLCVVATITGAFFAYAQWGRFWEWDFRQTSIFLQLMIYAAYFALRSSFDDEERRARLSATYSILAFATVPFLIWILPRVVPQFSQHEQANNVVVGGGMDATYAAIFYSSAVVIFLVSCWVYKLRTQLFALQRTVGEMDGTFDFDSRGLDAGSRLVEPVRLRDPNPESRKETETKS